MVSVKKIFAKNLKRIRKERGLSQEKFAEIVGMQFRSISNLETAKNFVNPDNLDKICKSLNILPSEFFSTLEEDKDLNFKIKKIKNYIATFNEEKLDYSLAIIEAIHNK